MLRKGNDISRRLGELALVAVQASRELPRDATGRHIAIQLVKSVTGAGANYEEARAAESRDDFVHKVGVAAKEMREGLFWLTLVERSGWIKTSLATAVREADELASILGASSRTARANAHRA